MSIVRLKQASAFGVILVSVLLMLSGKGWAETSDRESLRVDLFATITLAGYYCQSIDSVIEAAQSDFRVECRSGKRFRVRVTEEGTLSVVDRTPQISPLPVETDTHDTRVARSLFAIVNLLGQDCDQVVKAERGPRLHYRVWCANEAAYSIVVLSDGRLAISRQH